MPIYMRAAMTAHSLLSWAVYFVKREVECWEDSYSVGSVIDDANISVELRDARRWLKEAERELARDNLGDERGN